MRDQARVVIVGGGIYGVSIAYHLAKLGWTDIVLLEKGEIASGESAQAAGLVTQFATSQTLMQFRKYAIELYSELKLFDHVGSLRLASSKEQLGELQRSVSRAKGIGMDVEIISPSEAIKIMPQLSSKDLYGAIYLPRDGHLDPYITTTSMARIVREMGVEVKTNTRVTGIKLSPKGEVREVLTEKGSILTENVVNAAGLWGPRVAAMAGLHLPTTPVDHQHIALKAVPGNEFPHSTPCLRDPDNLVYMREEAGGLVIGGYEPNPKARWIDGVPWEHGGTCLTTRLRPLRAAHGRRNPPPAIPGSGGDHHPGLPPRSLHAGLPTDPGTDARSARFLECMRHVAERVRRGGRDRQADG
jgi:sarcosine dehydrogenase